MKLKSIFFGTIIYCLFSLSSVFMKFASAETNLFYKLLLFGASILLLGIFSVLWQKLLSKMNLNRAYYFKGTTLIWGLIFGVIFFQETVTINMIIGLVICLSGVIIILGDKNYD